MITANRAECLRRRYALLTALSTHRPEKTTRNKLTSEKVSLLQEAQSRHETIFRTPRKPLEAELFALEIGKEDARMESYEQTEMVHNPPQPSKDDFSESIERYTLASIPSSLTRP